MPNEGQEAQKETEPQSRSQGGSGANTALKVAAAAAATGAAAYAARKAVTRDGGSSNGQNGQGSERGGKQDSGMVGSIVSGSWDAAREQLLPLAEEAAGAAGKFVARNGPDILRDRLVPKFISSFENARD